MREVERRAGAYGLQPIRWPEPFGLVMTEAMACGTPVIAFREGSAPELVVDGETGFVVDDEQEMAAAVGRLDEIDPAALTGRFEAMEDEAYGTPDEYVGINGVSWLHRWRKTLGMENRLRLEPDPPRWLIEAAR